MKKHIRFIVKQFVPYGVMRWWLKERYGVEIDRPFLHYRGFAKILRRAVKWSLPFCVVMRVRVDKRDDSVKIFRRLVKSLLPYGFVCWWRRHMWDEHIDETLFFYQGFAKRVKRLAKFSLPYGLVMKYRAEQSTGGIPPSPMAQVSYDSWYEDDGDYSNYCSDVKPIAFYLPQFHTFKENDEWWGKGFTEWTNTRKSRPRFPSHYQPREPHPDIGYYDLSDWRVIARQAELAKRHGIYGFCFYNYWFSGKRLMEKPVDLLLAHPEIDIHFCLCWANENWTRRWDGNDDEVLICQNYENDSVQYIADLKKYVDDPRYIRVDGRPIVLIYRPSLLPDATKTFTRWREWARENGIGEILIWIQRGCSQSSKSDLIKGADAEVEFSAAGTAKFNYYDPARVGVPRDSCYLPSYRDLVEHIVAGQGYVERFDHKVYRGVMLGWDNSARRDKGAYAWYGFSLPLYYQWVRYVTEWTKKHFPREASFFFINAWNEWAEGTYLEPDKRFGYSSINVTSRALFNIPLHPKRIKGNPFVSDEREESQVNHLISCGISIFPYGLFWMYHNCTPRKPSVAWSLNLRQENSSGELQRLKDCFVKDEQNVMTRLRLKRLMFDEQCNPPKPARRTVAVHLHLFYPDMLSFFRRYLENITLEYDLYVSIPDGVVCDLKMLEFDLRQLSNVKNIIIRRCENRGRDIAPLICLFGADLARYDYVAHFHSKKSLYNPNNTWAPFIMEHLLGSPDQVSYIFNLMEKGVGMVSPPDYLMMPEDPSGWGSNIECAQDLVDRLGLKFRLKRDFPVIEFPQGSMFWARRDFVRRMLTTNLRFSDFPVEPIGTDGTLAHAFERMLYLWGYDTNRDVVQLFLKGDDMCDTRMW